ncbi:MAG: hypothetical protein HY331_10540 [Chloroflexi bacterium]|nr:hypothetical protein [Chloroflexota bacterium]
MKVRVIEPEELKKAPRATKVDLAPYKKALMSIPEGGALDVTLDPGESSRSVKRRFTSAAGEIGREIIYRTSKEGSFRIAFR